MQQAKIYWDMENYPHLEKIFRKSVEFCNEHDVWKLNVAHVLFMQENKYKEAAGFYEPIVKKNYDNVRYLKILYMILAMTMNEILRFSFKRIMTYKIRHFLVL